MKSTTTSRIVYILCALVIISFFYNTCSGQMTIPLVKGSVVEGNILKSEEGAGQLFKLYESTMEATTTEVSIDFRRLKYERPNNLTYPIDSIDISQSVQDGYEKITLWTAVEFALDNAEKIIIIADDVVYRMYIYYPESIFYFSGKVH